jgi:DNA sulfur modification protein DndD
MVFSAIHLQNFKSFYGDYKIENLDKGLSENQNIILFGGINGAGKTTFLEAVFLCFYGMSAELHPSKGAKYESYESYIYALLSNKVRETGLRNPSMSVEVFLNDIPITSNIPRNISIKRTWSFTDNGYKSELLEILENDKPINELDISEYQERIEAILPRNVSQFFFFDGERIQDFAGDSDSEFAKSLKDVLGINLYAKLAKDLKEVRSRILSEYNRDKDSNVKINEHRTDKARFENENQSAQIEIDTLGDEVSDLDTQIESIELETQRVTRISASSRDDYELERTKLEGEKEALESSYSDFTMEYLPFVLSSYLFPEIAVQLSLEQKISQIKATQAAVEPQIESIIESIFDNQPSPNFEMTKAIRRYFELKIDTALRAFLGSNTEGVSQTEILHNLVETDIVKIRQFFGTIDHDITTRMAKTADRLKQIGLTLEKIRNTEIRSGSNTDFIQELFDKMDKLKEARTLKNERIRQLKATIEQNKTRIETSQREITNWEKRAKVSDQHKSQMEYAERMLKTIQEFQKRFQATRTVELENEILWMWNELNHKPDWINRFSINPEANFEIRLYDSNNGEIDKTKLSAGEKEIFAIALLWALSKVSGKRLPIIIDTPFGRLDSIHRLNLVKNYFPKASHQVIILSQDEEIKKEYYDLIQPCISKEYTIENIEGISVVSDGYPFKNKL